MGLFMIWTVYCVWQFNAVQTSGLKLPLTSIAYTAPDNTKSLSLSFSQRDSIEPKINKIEDNNLKTLDTNSFSKDEKAMKTNFVSKLLEKIRLTDPKTRDNTFEKQQCLDTNVSKDEILAPAQNNLSNMKKSEDDKNIPGTEKNTVNYSIKVISPPAVFNINAGNVAPTPKNYKMISNTKKSPNSIFESSQVLYPSKSYDKRTQEFIPKRPNFNYQFNNGGRENTIQQKLQNKIDIAGSELLQLQDKERNEIIETTLNTVESPLEYNNRKSINDYKNLLKYNPPSNNPLLNDYKIPTNLLDVSLEIDNSVDSLDIINKEKAVLLSPLDKEDMEFRILDNNLNCLKTDEPKSISNYPPLVSGQLPINLYLQPNPTSEFIPPTNQEYSTDNNGNSNLSSSLDKLISFFTTKFLSVLPNISANSPDKNLNLSKPIAPTPTNLSRPKSSSKDITQSVTELIPSGNELEYSEYLYSQKEDIIVQDTVFKDTPTKLPAPYLSSVTINYMPSLESSNEIVIFV